jgi:hypothetical protein
LILVSMSSEGDLLFCAATGPILPARVTYDQPPRD